MGIQMACTTSMQPHLTQPPLQPTPTPPTQPRNSPTTWHRLSEQEVWKYTREVLAGLDYLHANHVSLCVGADRMGQAGGLGCGMGQLDECVKHSKARRAFACWK